MLPYFFPFHRLLPIEYDFDIVVLSIKFRFVKLLCSNLHERSLFISMKMEKTIKETALQLLFCNLMAKQDREREEKEKNFPLQLLFYYTSNERERKEAAECEEHETFNNNKDLHNIDTLTMRSQNDFEGILFSHLTFCGTNSIAYFYYFLHFLLFVYLFVDCELHYKLKLRIF